MKIEEVKPNITAKGHILSDPIQIYHYHVVYDEILSRSHKGY